jgi:hypothetical protein
VAIYKRITRFDNENATKTINVIFVHNNHYDAIRITGNVTLLCCSVLLRPGAVLLLVLLLLLLLFLVE